MKKNQLNKDQAIKIIENANSTGDFSIVKTEAKRYAFPANKEVSDTLCKSKDGILAYTTGCKEDGRMPGRSIVAAAFRHFGTDREVIQNVCVGNPLDPSFEVRFAALFCDSPDILESYLMNDPYKDVFFQEVADLAAADGWLKTIETVEAKVREKKALPNQVTGNSLADFGLKL